jgi:hypothetical protein
MCEGTTQLIMESMNTTVLNYHLATARAADIERGMQHVLVREPATKRRRGFAGRRDRRVALKARLIG